MLIPTEYKNCIVFSNYRAIDFTEQMIIELSLTDKSGFVKIHPYELMGKLCELKHLRYIFNVYFLLICKRIPQYADKYGGDSVDKFTDVYYKCYSQCHHSHEPFGVNRNAEFTLENAISHIIEYDFAIQYPDLRCYAK